MSRNRRKKEKLSAPTSEYVDSEGNVLILRGSLTPGSRMEYANVRKGIDRQAAATQEDNWQRTGELLFERLAVRWVIAGSPIDRQKELLGRFRLASTEERAWVREVMRKHCAEYFPDVEAP